MVTILKINQRFFSIRWKLVFTYLLLIVLTLGLMLTFVMKSLEERQVEDHIDYLFTQANVLSNQLVAEFPNLSQQYTNNYYAYVVTGVSKEIGARIMIFDSYGQTLIDSFSEFGIDTELTNHELNRALMGSQASNIYAFKEVGRLVYVAVPVENQQEIVGAILLTSSLEPIYDSQTKLLSSLFLLSVVCVGITAATSFIFVEILSSPIEKLTELVNRIAYGKYDQKLEVDGNDEMKVLSNSFNAMMTKLDHVDTQRKQFVSNVSHELRTPLTSIKLLSSSLLSDDEINPEIYTEFLQDIDQEVDRLNGIIDGLLYLVNLEKKELELKYTNTQVNFLIKKVVSQLRPLAKQKDIEIDIRDNENVWAVFDNDKLHQCLLNLIENAIKYNGQGGHVLVQLIGKRNAFLIEIIDDGYGIKEDSLPFVFDRFYRTDKARTRKTGGTGLGLSIVQQIVHLHQGEIRVESVLNEGTKVTIELPRDIV